MSRLSSDFVYRCPNQAAHVIRQSCLSLILCAYSGSSPHHFNGTDGRHTFDMERVSHMSATLPAFIPNLPIDTRRDVMAFLRLWYSPFRAEDQRSQPCHVSNPKYSFTFHLNNSHRPLFHTPIDEKTVLSIGLGYTRTWEVDYQWRIKVDPFTRISQSFHHAEVRKWLGAGRMVKTLYWRKDKLINGPENLKVADQITTPSIDV